MVADVIILVVVADYVYKGEELVVDRRDAIRHGSQDALKLGYRSLNVQAYVCMHSAYGVDGVTHFLEKYGVILQSCDGGRDVVGCLPILFVRGQRSAVR